MFRKIVSGAFEGLINDFPVLSTVTWNLTLRGIGPPTDTTSLCFDLNGGTYDVRIIGIQPGSVGDINSDGKVDIKDTGFIAGHFSEINPHLPFLVLLNALPLDDK